MSERASIGVTKNESNGDAISHNPHAASRLILPATHIHDLGRAEGQHEDANYYGVDRNGLTPTSPTNHEVSTIRAPRAMLTQSSQP